MSHRFLIIYLDENNLKCVKVLESTRISHEISENKDITNFLDFEGYEQCTQHDLIVHRIFGMGNILKLQNIDPNFCVLEIDKSNSEIKNTTFDFIETISQTPESVFKFYTWIDYVTGDVETIN